MLARYVSARKDDLVPCDRCGLIEREEYSRWKREKLKALAKPTGICELDLDEKELATYRLMRVNSPHEDKQTVLSWIEGQRYDPSKDPEFVKDAREKFRAWRSR
jgi:hypothetical protein